MNTPQQRVGGYKLIFGYLGYLYVLIGLVLLVPLLSLLAYPQETGYIPCFAIPAACAIGLGILLTSLLYRRQHDKLHKHQETIVVLFTWISAIAFCAVPFVLCGSHTVPQAVFEAASGLSATGLSVMVPEQASRIFLLYRSVLMIVGGVGLILILSSVMSQMFGMRLYAAEGHSDRLLPSLLKSARMILTIYAGYVLAGTVLYTLCGMPVFDAINHSISAASTGGYSTLSDSIGSYNSLSIELISIVLMLVGHTNFFMMLMLLRGRAKAFFRHCEVRLSAFLIAFALPIVTVLLAANGYGSLPHSARIALFQVVSAITTTGFTTTRIDLIAQPILLLLVVLMIIGGGVGSTSGGLKLHRVCVAGKAVWYNLLDKFAHQRVIHPEPIQRFGRRDLLTEKEKQDVFSFILLYLAVLLCGTLAISLQGYPVFDAFFEFASAMTGTGYSVGIAQTAPAGVCWTLAAGMLIGRLEVYAVFLGGARIISDISHQASKRRKAG